MSNVEFRVARPIWNANERRRVYIEGKLNVIKNALIACKGHETRLMDYFPALE